MDTKTKGLEINTVDELHHRVVATKNPSQMLLI